MKNLNFLILTLLLSPLLGTCLIALGRKILTNSFIAMISIFSGVITLTISLYLLHKFWINDFKTIQGVFWIFARFGSLKFHFGFLLDKLNLIMLNVVTILSLIIQVYSSSFMTPDPGYARYFGYLGFFIFATILLVIADNFLQFFCGWELIGVSAYLLINFWFMKNIVNVAGFKSLLINKLGDLGLLLAIATIWKEYNSLDYMVVFAHIPKNSWLLNLIIGFIVFAVIIRSAQIPLHIWLPDAMQSPLPISTLVGSGIILSGGIFLLIRVAPWLEYANYWLNIILGIGGVTTVLAGLIACREVDLKKILAYSTISQLGVMFIAIGISAYSLAMFHLINHVWLKSLLFLSLGMIWLITNKNYNIFEFPLNLKKHSLICYIGVLIGCLSLIGFPFTACFFSNNLILEGVKLANLSLAKQAYYLLWLNNVITSFYTFRMFFLIFYPATHQTIARRIKVLPYRINGVMVTILFLLLSSIFIIIPVIKDVFLDRSILTGINFSIIKILPQNISKLFKDFLLWSINLPNLSSYLGIGIAFIIYVKKPHYAKLLDLKFKNNFLFLSKMLHQGYFLNEINNYFIVLVRKIANALLLKVEEKLINQKVVNSMVNFVVKFSHMIAKIHHNDLNHYIFISLTGMVMLLLWFILIKF